jgi:hypothetical protein
MGKAQVCSWDCGLHIGRHVGDDVIRAQTRRKCEARFSRSLFTLPHHDVHLVQQRSGIAGGGDAEDVALLQLMRRIGAEPVANLRREAVQLLVLADVELRQQVDQVEDVGYERRMESRFRFVDPRAIRS